MRTYKSLHDFTSLPGIHATCKSYKLVSRTNEDLFIFHVDITTGTKDSRIDQVEFVEVSL